VTPHAPDAPWQRLHPLSPVVRLGRVVVPLLVLVAVSSPRGGGSDASLVVEDVALVVVAVVVGVVQWLVTRWRIEGATLRIETGLLRRDSRQLPVARIQAVDVIRPFAARVLGLAELRIRLAGSGAAKGRLAYLAEPVAQDLRARLLAAHHGLDMATPEPPELPITAVPAGRLVGSVVLSAPTLVSVALAVAVVAAASVSRAVAVGLGGALVAYLIGRARMAWRRVAEQYGFTVGHAPDGIRIRRGLLSTVAETIPVRRVQAVRRIEPLLWRPLGWCRLEVELAGSAGGDQGTRAGTVTRALLPVGFDAEARVLTRGILGIEGVPLSPPPPRARLKAPFSYHFLGAGHGQDVAVGVTGRVCKVTCWVPLDKIQSVRRVQGPLQRRLGLATVHVDAAGRRVRAQFRDRSATEASRLLEELAGQARQARRARPESLDFGAGRGAPPPPGAALHGTGPERARRGLDPQD